MDYYTYNPNSQGDCLGYWHEHWLEICAKIINAIENVPNVLNGIRLLNSFMKLSWCNMNFNNTKKTKTVPIMKNMLLNSVNIFPSEKIDNIKPVIAKGKFFMIFII